MLGGVLAALLASPRVEEVLLLTLCGLPPELPGMDGHPDPDSLLSPPPTLVALTFPLLLALPVSELGKFREAERAEDATVFVTLALAVDTVVTKESKFFLAVSLKLSKFFFVDSLNVPKFFLAVSPNTDMALNNPKSGNSGNSDRSEGEGDFFGICFIEEDEDSFIDDVIVGV